jgi:hypothetical protein
MSGKFFIEVSGWSVCAAVNQDSMRRFDAQHISDGHCGVIKVRERKLTQRAQRTQRTNPTKGTIR